MLISANNDNGLLMSVTYCLFVFSPLVPYQPSSCNSERSSGPIHCFRCREVCKGEVVRVQHVHFHIKCFTCQGKSRVFGRNALEMLVTSQSHLLIIGNACILTWICFRYTVSNRFYSVITLHKELKQRSLLLI